MKIEVEWVTCPACLGKGFILWDTPDVEARCEQCGGSGEIPESYENEGE